MTTIDIIDQQPDIFSEADHWKTPIGDDGTPYAYIEELRDAFEEKPVVWSNAHGGFWIVGRYDEAIEVVENIEDFSNTQVTLPQYETGRIPLMMSEHDEPDHKRYRTLVASAFSPKAAHGYREKLREITNELIDSFIDVGEADIATQFAVQLPSKFTTLLLGVSPDDSERYALYQAAVTQMQVTDPERSREITAEMRDHARELIAQRRENPGTDLFSNVVVAEVDGDRLTDDELVGFFTVLLVGGIDNSTNFLGTTFWRLAWDRDLRRRLIREPKLIPSAVDELMRYYGPAVVGRKVINEVTVGGVTMKPGDFVLNWYSVINRDKKVFPYADTLIPDRAPNRHLSLGNGIHRCIGVHLARVEFSVAIEEMLRRLPEYRLDPTKEPVWAPGQSAGFHSVPILFPKGGGISDEH